MDHIINHDTTTIKHSIHRCTLSSTSNIIHHTNTNVKIDDAPLLHCHLNDNGFSTPVSPISRQMTHNSMPKIQEIDDSQPKFKIITLQSIERKIVNAPCPKRHRGLTNAHNKRCNIMYQQTELMGLQTCKIMQSDSGTTHNLTNKKHVLLHFKNIAPVPIAGIQADDTALYATGTGLLPLTPDEGDTILVECLYSKSAECTIISPTAIIRQYKQIYTGWTHHSNT